MLVFNLSKSEINLIKDNPNKSLKELGLIKVDFNALKLNPSKSTIKTLKVVKKVNKGFNKTLLKYNEVLI